MKEHEFHEHFPDDIEPKLLDYITNQVMDWSRYLFTHREGRKQWAHCTSCGQEFPTDTTLKHGTRAECVHCGQVGKVLASGRGRKRLVDIAYLLWYERSQADPNALIARGFYCTRDYTRDYRGTQTYVRQIARYLFRWGKGGIKMHRPYWAGDTWYSQKSVTSETQGAMRRVVSYHMPVDEIAKVVKGTPWQYCTWEKYDNLDFIGIFDLAAKYRCIEFLTKIGLQSVVEAKLGAGQTYGVINWHGETPEKVLRLTKKEIKEMRTSGVIITPEVLNFYHRSHRQGLNYTFVEAYVMKDLEEGYYGGEIRRMTELATASQIKKYLVKQYGKEEVRKNYRTGSMLFTAWRDYTRECKELGMDLKQDHILFPNNIYRSHQKTMKKIKIKADEALNDLISARLPDLNNFYFEKFGLILRPAVSKDELFAEGAALEHCVGSHYTKDYANGKTDIFLIRQAAKPDKPYYTMEVRNGNVLQCEGGKGSRAKTKLVEEFVNAFVTEKLTKKIKTRKTKSNKPQGVAV